MQNITENISVTIFDNNIEIITRNIVVNGNELTLFVR